MKKILALVATASLMFSCSQEEIIPDVERIPINISVGQQTRANDTTYENRDEVGIYVVNYDGSTVGSLQEEGNQVDNMRFEYNDNGGTWTPDAPIYWKDKSTSADFYAYYPYDASANVSAHPFSVAADQSAEVDFWASDFLWGKATKVSPTKSAVPIVTNHTLSRILVDIKPGNGFTENTWAAATKSVKICDVKTSATIDLSTGIATATGNNGEIIPLAAAKTGTTLSYQAMMIPQVVADNSRLVVITIDGTDYVYRKGYTFSRNTEHKFTVTVNKSGSSVDVTIGEWDIDSTTNEGDAEEESESESTIPNNQIWYTTTDGNSIEVNSDGFNVGIKSNTYENGKGIIVFEGDVTAIECIAFYPDATRIVSLTFPDSLTEFDKNTNSFPLCANLKEFNSKFATADKRCLVVNGELIAFAPADIEVYSIPEGIKSIGNTAFQTTYDGKRLYSVTIPESVIFIDYNAFYPTHITEIYCKRAIPPTGTSNMFGDKSMKSLMKIYVPVESVDTYKETQYWSDYAECIFADPTEN